MIRPTVIIIFATIFDFISPQTLCNRTSTSHHRVRRIIGGEPANYPPYDDPVVYVRFSGRAARVEGAREFPHYVFKGIKFAHPPTGKDRFLRPKEKFLEGEVKATTFPPPCIQPVPGTNKVVGSEDCLALNIFTPDLPRGTEGLPVIIWIHGGGFRYGSASQYGARHLVGQRLVVVTIQYRLGSLGFLSTGSKHLPGNVALWDMALAVQWVRNYIGFFGGNPHRIVVMGHDTSASSALLLTLTKISKGIPNAVVAMSGTAVSRWAIDHTPANTAKRIADENGCPTGSDVVMVKCLQQLSASSIIKGDSNIQFQQLQSKGFVSGLNGRLGTAPVAEGLNDGRSLPGLVEVDPAESLYNQENPEIPLLTGVCKDETKRAVKGPFKNDIVKQLTSVPNFLKKVLVEELRNTPVIKAFAGKLNRILGIGNITGSLLTNNENLIGAALDNTLNFDNYLKVKKNDITDNLDKIAEVTGDALFNLPAFLTAQLWKGAPTYLYSFEHIGDLNKGSSFLEGLPLVANTSIGASTDGIVGHGDELSYLFDAQDFEGNPLPSREPTEDDIKVRQTFTRMVADFARHGEINVNNKKLPPFNAEGNTFVQIKPEPLVSNRFRFCEMALWTNIGERLKSGTCKFLRALDVGGVQQVVGDLKPIAAGNLPPLLPGLTGNSNKNSGIQNKPPLGLLNNKKEPDNARGGSGTPLGLGGIIG